MPESESALDRLASELAREVRDASAARHDSELASQFDGMTEIVQAVAMSIRQTAKVLDGPSPLGEPHPYREELRERGEWVISQVAKVRSVLESDPLTVRQGKLWAQTRTAFQTLRDELEGTLKAAYEELLDPYAADDLRVAETLPPRVQGAREYRQLIEQFERLRNQTPQSAEQIKEALAVAQKLRDLRESLESEGVPEEYREEWRQLRESGLPLTRASDGFVAWLHEHGLADAIVLSYRTQ
jgi:hypothetical protein